MSNIDEAKSIRKGEELNIESLEAFLQKELNQANAKLSVLQFPSGYSNLTYLINLGDTELVLRRPPFGAEDISKGHDMGREYKVLSLVNPVYPKAPKPLVYTEDKSIIGAPFYVMERVRGTILRNNTKIDYSPEVMRKLNENLVDNLADLHKIDIYENGLADIGKPEGYLERQVKGWTKRWEKAKTEDMPDMEFAIQWLANNMPESPKPTFIHNDYKYDNVVLDAEDNTIIKAVLDWEMSTVGDPYTDLGIMLGYTPEEGDPIYLKNFGIKTVKGALTRQEMLERYEAQIGQKIDNLVYYYAFAMFKLGVVVQQIYYRYEKGYTKDKRFAPLIYIGRDCAKLSASAIRENKISNFNLGK